ncbi:hypothetical protein BDP27DRAFT_1422622 [Rhodocollybia butyracea]|uniref:Uncharacterized protein n=1 Tax=Rhodocollybia butyracea TaxID=206335 RepID=A0A9P5PPS0_9AGAR|nr:hypothetical protein BDP27DRAFT_1422622 [Rhodocollybia butyracea]
MPTFTYDVPLNAVGTTVIAFPSLVSEQEFQDILRHPLPSSQQAFSLKLKSWVPILSEVKCADINLYGSELSGAFTGHPEDTLPIFDKGKGKAQESSRELFAMVGYAKISSEFERATNTGSAAHIDFVLAQSKAVTNIPTGTLLGKELNFARKGMHHASNLAAGSTGTTGTPPETHYAGPGGREYTECF